MHLLIDTREDNHDNQELIRQFGELSLDVAENKSVPKEQRELTFEIKQLDVGDIVCGNICIERKAANDFVSSLIDGRLEEQSAKMFQYPHKFIIIEGNLWEAASAMELNLHTVYGMMSSITVRKEIKFMMSANPEGTSYLVWSIVRRIQDGKTFNPEEFKPRLFVPTDEDIVTNMLACLPGVGLETAKKITTAFELKKPDDLVKVNKENWERMKEEGKLFKVSSKAMEALEAMRK